TKVSEHVRTCKASAFERDCVDGPSMDLDRRKRGGRKGLPRGETQQQGREARLEDSFHGFLSWKWTRRTCGHSRIATCSGRRNQASNVQRSPRRIDRPTVSPTAPLPAVTATTSALPVLNLAHRVTADIWFPRTAGSPCVPKGKEP